MKRRFIVQLVAASVAIGATAAVVVHETHRAPAATPPPVTQRLRGDANLMLGADVAPPRTFSGPPTWTQWAQDTDPTLICQGAFLNDSHPSTLLFRKFQTPLGHEPTDPVVREAVMEFDSETAAQKAYATASGWLATCPATVFPTDQGQSGPPATQGPPAALTVRGFEGQWAESWLPNGLTNTATYDQFVGLSGNRILVFEYSQDIEPSDTDPTKPFFDSLDKVARRAAL